MPHNIFTNASKSVREHNFAGDVSFDRMILYGCDSIWLWFGNLLRIWQIWQIISLLPSHSECHSHCSSFIPAFSLLFLINISLSVWRPNKGYHCKFSNFLSTLCFSPQCLELVTLWQVKRKQWSTTRKEKLVFEREFFMFGKV